VRNTIRVWKLSKRRKLCLFREKYTKRRFNPYQEYKNLVFVFIDSFGHLPIFMLKTISNVTFARRRCWKRHKKGLLN